MYLNNHLGEAVRIASIPILLLAMAGSALAQEMPDPVSFSLISVSDSVQAGTPFTMVVRAEIEEGWYLYSIDNHPDDGPIPTRFEPARDSLLITGPILESPPRVKYDPNFGVELGLHSGEAYFEIPLAIHPELNGEHLIGTEVRFQACDDISCLAPTHIQVSSVVAFLPAGEDIYTGFPEGGSTPQLFHVFLLMAIALVLILIFRRRATFRSDR
ncbi:MAG: protein-disulfide reductase DsbD domain-containing protein [Balneolaceae bacterium]